MKAPIEIWEKYGVYVGKDKRSYANIFQNNSGYIDNFKKAKILLTSKKIVNPENFEKTNNEIIIIDKGSIKFTGKLYENLHQYRELICKDLYKNISNENRKMLKKLDISDGVVVQIRMNEFKKVSKKELKEGIDNARIPLEWFENIIVQIRKIANKNVKVYLMSDGKDRELKKIYDLGNVERLELGSSICNILGMAKSKLIVASGSAFSLWARFLGQMSSISFENQYKEKVLENKENKFEIDIDDKIDEKYYDIIKGYFNT